MRFNKIYVEITNICNLNCSFCSNDNRKLKELSLEEFEIILKKIKPYTKNIYLHVKGEPLIHSKLDEILKLTIEYNFNVRITTNGVFLKEKYSIIKKYDNIKQLNISLHSENKKKNYFEDIFETVDKLNIPTIYRIWTLKNNKLNKLSTLIVDKIINYYKLDNNFKDLVIKNNNIHIKNNIYLDKANMFIWPDNININNLNKGTCLGTRTHIGILSNGTVIPCCLDSKGLINLGNIFKDNLEDILKSSKFKEIHDGFINHKLVDNLCKNCHYRSNKFIVKKGGKMAKYCSNCGKELKSGADICLNCGKIINGQPKVETNKDPNAKSKVAAGILGILLGCFGVHNFYLGYTSKAIAQLLITILSCFILCPVSAIWGLIEGIMILTGNIDQDATGRKLTD